MDKNEIITLSSDDECEFTNHLEHNLNSSTIIKPLFKSSDGFLKSYLEKFKQISINRNIGVIIKSSNDEVKIVKLSKVPEKKCTKGSKESPELVDLVECTEKPNESSQAQFQSTNHNSSQTVQNHSKLDIIDVDEIPNYPSSDRKIDIDVNLVNEPTKIFHNLPLNVETNEDNTTTDVVVNNILKPSNNSNEIEGFQSKLSESKTYKGCNQNFKFFTEFVEFCGSLEIIPNDRARLTKKLMKRYGEADSSYVKSQEFRILIEKCRDKLNANNLYLIAKEITDELSFRKKIEISKGKSVQLEKTEEKSERSQQSFRKAKKATQNNKKSRKRTKIINQIYKKLDKLGNIIRELEKKEVDLSDEEESSFVQLQRYRERFCQIYTKLGKYTNDFADADRIYNPKICFTESKYPAINKCIENWLNKTKRFPDFTDILKLLESQSSLLGLPSNRESVRTIAIEIFQQVGAMLQRRRIYDLWDSFCEFLDSGEDPANSDPVLDQVLKSNFEFRIKKEQEIFQHFTELQEKERLEPEEVPDEEANRSPVESGSEDDKELEDIENSVNRKLDDAIKKDTEENDITVGNKDWDGGGYDSGTDTERLKLENIVMKSKESKNNFRNCKSLKWRSENGGKITGFHANSEDSKTKTKIEKKKISDKDDSDLELITVENFKSDTKKMYNKVKTERNQSYLSPSKRAMDRENKDPIPKKKKCSKNSKNEKSFNVYDFGDETDNPKEKTNGVFNVYCCQIYADNVFEDLYEKKKAWEKRKVFRDLTNVNRLMELHGKRKKLSGLYSPSFFHQSFYEFEKSTWKKRFKVSFKFVGSKDQKCALNQEEKSGKTLNSDSGGDTDEKDIQNNSKSGKDDEGDSFFSGHGNGSEEDNNEDKNKKNGRSSGKINDNQFEEEDEDEEENEAETNDSKLEDETLKHFFPNQRTEKPPITTLDNKKFFKIENDPNESDEGIYSSVTLSEMSASEQIKKKEVKEPSEEKLLSAKEIIEETQETSVISKERIGLQYNDQSNKLKIKEDFQNEEQLATYNLEIECKDKISKSEEDQSENSDLKMKVQNITGDEGKFMEMEELKMVSQSTEKKKNEVMSENSDTKTESLSQSKVYHYLKAKSENLSTTPDKRKENVNSKAAEEIAEIKKAVVTFKKNECEKTPTLKPEIIANKSVASWKSIQLGLTSHKFQKRNTPSTSDEERVKRFLLHSPSSISITPPRKLSLSKPPSQAALQALATLRKLKGISATIVRGKPKKEEDVVVIGGSYKRHMHQNSNPAKRKRSDLPVISSVQSVDSTTPKIVTVQGNVSGFGNSWPVVPNNENLECNSSSIRISNVWGGLPNNFMQSAQNIESVAPGCSSHQSNPGSSYSLKKKNTKKTVEYVVLE